MVSFEEHPPLLRCSGAEDRGSQSLRRPALSRAIVRVQELRVDLTDLTFADSSLMLDLAIVARRLRSAGAEMRICGAQPQIDRLIEMVGVDRLPGVVVERAQRAAVA